MNRALSELRAVPGGRAATEDDRLRRFAAIWGRALHPAITADTPLPDFERRLVPLARQLRDAVSARPFETDPAYQVGAALVEEHCTDPEALPLVLGVVDAYLLLYFPPHPALAAEEGRARCARLQHALAAGFASALRERACGEQEARSRAALAARAEAEQALHISQERFRAMFRGAAIGVGIAALDGRVLVVNDAVSRMFGRLPQNICGENIAHWSHPEDPPAARGLYRELITGVREFFRIEKPFHRTDSTVLWTNLTVMLLRDSSGGPQYQLVLLEDITERRKLRERLRYEATHDGLTGLPNRTQVLQRLDGALSSGPADRQFGLCLVDLDDFKTVNDSLGHAVGDDLLVAVAGRLRSCARGTGELVARAGGDEFVALVTGTGAQRRAVELARRMLEALGGPVRLGDRELRVRASIGVAGGTGGELGRAEVLRSADIAMYRAKAGGGNRYEVADADSDAQVIARHSLSNRLPSAFDNGEFFIEYQPLVRLRDGTVHGAEALVRWLHPVHGVLGPDQFIPLAESSGLIVPLGRWVLQEAARQVRGWRAAASDSGPALRVNVNVSPCQLRAPGLVADTVAVLKEEGLDATALCLEVTENALIGADEEALRPLRQLADLGVDIALDDFGTGYSNLSYLRRLPVSTLKLDRSFTRGMQREPADPVDMKIVEGIVSLAHTLDLAVTVEGVETGTQAEHLRTLGCDTAQGWYYARPGPPESLHTLALADATGG